MALNSLRLRRTLTAISSLNRWLRPSPSCTSQSDFSSVSGHSALKFQLLVSRPKVEQSGPLAIWNQVSTRLYSTKQYKLYKEGDEITEDTVLFEGCDYNHWLITMDFPKDNPPSREEMIATYEQTCAKGLRISLEEAKKRMYACSTTTYQGFQAVMTEAESEQFRDLPGVVFILPDSYIDPVNKEYGGDKYENGVITHRPPPVQYGRGGRLRDRNRDDRRGAPMQNRQGGFGGPQNYAPQQNWAPQGQRPMNNNNYGYGGPYQGDRRGPPPYQGNYNQGGGMGSPMPPCQGNYNPGGPGSPMPPPPQGNYNQGGQGGPFPPHQGNFNQGAPGGPMPPFQGTYNNPAGQGNYHPHQQRNFQQGGNYEQPPNSGYGQGHPGHGQSQPFPQGDPRNVPGAVGQSGTDQGRF